MNLNGVITTPVWLLSIRLGYRIYYHQRKKYHSVDETFLSKFVFYVVLFELMVKKIYRNILCDDCWFISVI